MKNKKYLLVLAMAMIAIFVVAGCGSSTTSDNKSESKASVLDTVYTQWSASGHAKTIDEGKDATTGETKYVGKEANCWKCHDGNGFSNQATVKDVKELGSVAPTGVTCDTCHTAYGADIMKKGTVKVPFQEAQITAGKGALCISCHNGRGKKPDQKSAPHGAVQSDVLFGKSGAEVAGFTYGNPTHASNPNACLSCHMAGSDVKDHSFKVDEKNIKNSCGTCHKDFTSFNPTAQGDYDGNGKKEGIQTEVEGLLKLVQGEIDKKVGTTVKLGSGSGKIIAYAPNDKDKKPIADYKIDPAAYNAQWNVFLVTNDGSKGIHNATYTVQLLQQSYKALTGKDVPGAEIRK